MKGFAFGVVLFTGALLVPATASAQSTTTGAIAGSVRDATGAVLPGVTVEAASPALIEKVRTATSDAQGNYKILDLRPGSYTVTFTLPGFSTFKREGIELSTGFTGTVNAEMKVGSVEETVTVTSASPVVDIQNVRSQTVLTRQLLDSMPAPQTMMGFTTLTLGASSKTAGGTAANVDVGGSKGENTPTLSIHGMRAGDMRQLADGMSANNIANGGGRRSYMPNQAGIQEIVMATGNASAEIETGGVVLNVVPKDGGNTFKFIFNGAYTNSSLQADNLDDDIRNAGVTAVAGVKTIYDWGAGLGGPIKQDKLWFYSANRWWGATEYQPGSFYSKSTSPYTYVPDPDRKGYLGITTWDIGGRITWQATPKHKFTFSDGRQNNCQCPVGVSATSTPEATQNIHYEPMQLVQGTWNYPASNRLLLEAGLSYAYQPLKFLLDDQQFPGAIGIRELSTGLVYAGTGTGGFSTSGGAISDKGVMNPLNQRFSISYVGGSHALKVGEQLLHGLQRVHQDVPQQLGYNFLNGRPSTLQQMAGPFLFDVQIQNLGLYAQDQWTINRLTLNLGVRYDNFIGWAPAGTREAGRFITAFSYDKVSDVPNFKDVNPRIGAAYDIFGNGKTAIKGSFGRYVAGIGTEVAILNHPAALVVTTATRTWNDANSDFVPDCDLTNFTTNGECGPLSNSLFGQPFRNTFYDDSVLEGSGNRAYSWQSALSLQHELRPGVALTAGYFRTQYGAMTVVQNQAVAASDFSGYCVNAPTDARLPGGGGNQICGLFDVAPAKFGQVRSLVTQASDFGEQKETFDGVDIGANARLGRGALVQGGVSFGRKITDTCFLNSRPDIAPQDFANGITAAVTTPRDSAYCHVAPPWSAGTQYKANGIYPLKWGIEPSFTFQNLPGGHITATYNAPNSVIAPSLGRNLSACGAAVTCTATAAVALIPSQTEFLDRVTLLDVRVTKSVRVSGMRVKGILDVYNLFNTNTILDIVNTYGPAWQRPTSIVGGRLFKFGAQVDF